MILTTTISQYRLLFIYTAYLSTLLLPTEVCNFEESDNLYLGTADPEFTYSKDSKYILCSESCCMIASLARNYIEHPISVG